MGTRSNTDDPASYSSAEKAVKAQQYRKAIGILEKVVAENPRNADAYNYLGYSYRELGEYTKAKSNYDKALNLHPNHRGANEYLGQLYLKTGNMAGAKAQLAKLARICGPGCEEYDSLKAAIDRSGS
jgi:Flp pilus assembly protein TadD